MDIERISMDLASSNTLRSFNIGMIRRSMDNIEQVGEQVAEMIRQIPSAPSPQQIAAQGGRVNVLA